MGGFPLAPGKHPDSIRPLKSKSQRPEQVAHPPWPTSQLPRGAGRSAVPGWRRWLYRGLALVLVPVLLFGLAETVLRIAGYGHPTRFLLPSRQGNQDVLVENPQFGRLFFPAALARSPAPTVIAARKPPGTFRILLFGESAALGDPRFAFGMARYLEVLLQERFPQARFEVVPIAMTAINSHALRLMAREAADYEGDLWIVYAGNNEMVGPFGAATTFGPRAPSLAFVRAGLALRSTRTGQGMAALAERWGGRAATNTAWTGLKMFLESQLAPDDPGRQRVYAHFENNLEAIVRSGIRARVPVVLSTVAVNLKDCGPFASLPTSRLEANARADFVRRFETGRTNQATGDWTAALDAYTQAAGVDPRFAELQFRLGECLLRLDRPSDARAALERACGSDALPFRADAAINAAIQRVAARHSSERVVSIDSAQQLAAFAPSRVPGRESFFEHVHPNFEGNYRLGRILAETVVSFLPEPARRDAAADWADPDLCARRLGLTDWNRHAVVESVLRRTSDAPYTNQLTSLANRDFLARELAGLRMKLTLDRQTNAYALYREALLRRPNDFRLHENFAEFLEATDHLREAVTEWEAVRDLIPHHFAAYVNVGRLLNRLSRGDAARRSLETAVRLEPRSPEAWLELAQAIARQEQWPAAADAYLQVLRLQPGNARVYVQLADALARLGKRAEAVEMLRQAARLDPGFSEARYLLGVEFAMSGNLPEAQAEFEATLLRKPHHVLARLNLGVALVRQGETGPARRQFEEVLRLDPANEKARHYLNTLDSMLQAAPPPADPAATRR